MYENIIQAIKNEIEAYERRLDKHCTKYARGEHDGATGALRHLLFVVRSMSIKEDSE